ncbi:hypothetical protein [Bradyrhizobium sp. USDA 4519]
MTEHAGIGLGSEHRRPMQRVVIPLRADHRKQQDVNDQHHDPDPEQRIDETIDRAADHDPRREHRGQQIHRELDRRAGGVGAQRQ